MSTKVIAEIGCNHMGDFDLAVKMINIAATECNADIIKFQKRDNKKLLSNNDYNLPHPVPENSYGSTYGEHRDYLEFNLKQHKRLKKICEKYKKIYCSSVWDINSTKEILSLNPEFIKIPSAQNLNFELLDYVFQNNSKKTMISLGMTTSRQINEIIQLSIKRKYNKKLIILHCTSDYPAKFKDIHLNEITHLINKYSKKIDSVGFSGHHNGISIDLGAATLGASYIERHFTLNRTFKGTDHAASLEPTGLRKLKRNLLELEEALKIRKNRNKILNTEKIQFYKLKKNYIKK